MNGRGLRAAARIETAAIDALITLRGSTQYKSTADAIKGVMCERRFFEPEHDCAESPSRCLVRRSSVVGRIDEATAKIVTVLEALTDWPHRDD